MSDHQTFFIVVLPLAQQTDKLYIAKDMPYIAMDMPYIAMGRPYVAAEKAYIAMDMLHITMDRFPYLAMEETCVRKRYITSLLHVVIQNS